MMEAQKRAGNEQDLKTVLKTAGGMLMRARRYAPAAELMAAAASGDNASITMVLAATLRKAQNHEEMKLEDSPSGLVMRFFLNLLDPDMTLEKLQPLYSRNALRVMNHTDPEDLQKTLNAGRKLRSGLKRGGYPPEIMIDTLLAAMQVQSEGDDSSGYRVTLQRPGNNKLTMWVIREGGVYKILDGADQPNSIGLEVLDRLATGNLAGARVLLDWVRDEKRLPGGDDPLAGAAFSRLWTKGKEADAERMKHAAAAILAQTKPTARDAVGILMAARDSAKTDTEKTNLSLALLSAYDNLEEFEKVYALAAELAKQYPDSKRLFIEQEFALRGLHRFTEADALAKEMTKRLPDDIEVRRAFILNAIAQEDYSAAHALGQKLIDEGKAEASDMNGVAWNALFTRKVNQDDLDAATKSAQQTQNRDAAVLHTLGCMYAEMGKTREAREILVQAMGMLGLDELDSDFGYAFGRIAEQYGELDVAKADYLQAKKPSRPLQIPGSSYSLAQKRLAVMHGSISN